MTKRKSVIAILFVLMMLASVAGCTQTNGEQDKVIVEPIDDGSPIDLGKFVVVCEHNGVVNESQNELVFKHVKQKVLEDYNYIIDGEFIYFSSATFVEELGRMLAEGKAVDGISASNKLLAEFANYEYLLMDVRTLLDRYGTNINGYYSTDDLLQTKVNSRYIGIPDKSLNQQYYSVIRADVLEQLEQEVPTTYDQLVDLCEMVLDEGLASYPIGLTLQQIQRSWLASWSMPSEVFVGEDDSIWPVEYHDNFHRFLEDMKYLYKNKYVSKDFANVISEEQRENFINEKSTIWELKNDDSYAIYDDLLKVNEDAKLQVMENIVVTSISEVAQINENNANANSLFFLTSGTGQEALMVFKDYTGASKENYLSILLGVEGEHFEFTDGMNSIVYPKEKYSIEQIYGGELMINTGFDLIYPPTAFSISVGTLKLSNELDIQAYDYMKNAKIIQSGISIEPKALNAEANNAKVYYKMRINDAIKKYIQGSISFSDFQLLLEELSPQSRLWCDEISAS